MSTSLLAFLTVLEERAQPLLPTGAAWRFQRLVDFKAREAVLQLWSGAGDASLLTGQINVRESRPENSLRAFAGSVQAAAEGSEPRSFAFAPDDEAEVGRQVETLAEQLRQLTGGQAAPDPAST